VPNHAHAILFRPPYLLQCPLESCGGDRSIYKFVVAIPQRSAQNVNRLQTKITPRPKEAARGLTNALCGAAERAFF
jgi:hypothetical protein